MDKNHIYEEETKKFLRNISKNSKKVVIKSTLIGLHHPNRHKVQCDGGTGSILPPHCRMLDYAVTHYVNFNIIHHL